MSIALTLRISTTLWTGPLPRMGSTRMLPSSSTRAISEPKTEVAPPAGAVITVTVFAFMESRLGSFHVSSGLGMPSGGAALSIAVPITLTMREAISTRGRTRILTSPGEIHNKHSGEADLNFGHRTFDRTGTYAEGLAYFVFAGCKKRSASIDPSSR